MASENALNQPRQRRRSTSENTRPSPARHRGAAGTPLAPGLVGLLEEYRAALARAPLSSESRRTYLSKIRQFLAWLGAAAVDGDPLVDTAARDWAVRDYRSHLQAVTKAAPATANSALAAIDDLYARRGLGRANAAMGEVDGEPVVATASDDGTVRLWDARTGRIRRVLKGHGDRVFGVAMGEVDGEPVVATASNDGTARLWDARRGVVLRTLEGHDGVALGRWTESRWWPPPATTARRGCGMPEPAPSSPRSAWTPSYARWRSRRMALLWPAIAASSSSNGSCVEPELLRQRADQPVAVSIAVSRQYNMGRGATDTTT